MQWIQLEENQRTEEQKYQRPGEAVREEQSTRHEPPELATTMGREAYKSSSDGGTGKGVNMLVWGKEHDWNVNLNPTPILTRCPEANYLTSDPQLFHL